MRVPGKRVKRKRLVQTDRFVVVVEMEAVVPDADPSEPCFESETVEFIKEVHHHALAGDREWLMRHGIVCERVAAA